MTTSLHGVAPQTTVIFIDSLKLKEFYRRSSWSVPSSTFFRRPLSVVEKKTCRPTDR